MSGSIGCPVCGKPVDAVRARFVRVVAGQVIAYCSSECKSQETEAIGNVLATGRSGAMPAAAVVTSPAPPPAEPSLVVAVPAGDVDNAVTAPQHSPPAPEPAVLTKKAEKPPKPDKAKIAEPKIVEAAKAPATSASVEKAALKVDAQSAVPSPKTGDKAPTAAPANEALTAKVLPAKTTPAAAAVARDDDTIADSGDTSDPVIIARQRRNWMIAVVAAVVLISILAIWKIVGSSASDPVPAPASPIGAAKANAGSAVESTVVGKSPGGSAMVGTDPSVEAASALVQSRVALNDMLKSKSLRLRRMAAAALARTGDESALSSLATVSAEVEGDLAKAEIAYAIARGGNAKGRDELAARMNTTRRDAKADAARLLSQLGDPRAVTVLKGFLDITQHSLSAAEQLARSKDPAAIPALQKIMAKPDLTSDEKSRVTIALAVAGQADVVSAVEQMLGDQRFNHAAAVALASLGKSAAAKTLREQLNVAALRVQAARSLRLLSVRDPSVTVTESLPGLLADLKSDKDTARASAAEALLLLTGDAAWGAYE